MSDETPPQPGPIGWAQPENSTPGWRTPPPAPSGWSPATPPAPPEPAAPVPFADLQPRPAAPRRHPWRWATSLVVVVALAAATAVVATNGHHKKTPLQVLTAASGQTTAAGTAHMTSTATLTEGGRSAVALNVEGDSDFVHKASSLTISGRGSTGEQVRIVDGVEYLSVPTAVLPGGAHWLSIHPSELGLDPGTSSVGSNDPSSGLRYLSAVNGDPRVVGNESVDGVDTTHYTFTIDIKSFLDKLSKSMSKISGREDAASSLGALDGLIDLTKIPAQAWIDHDGRVRQFSFTLTVSELGQSIKEVTLEKFSQFDEPVSISTPSASDTVPFSSFPDFFKHLASPGSSGITS